MVYNQLLLIFSFVFDLSVIKLDTLFKKLKNQIQQYIKRMSHHGQARFILRTQVLD